MSRSRQYYFDSDAAKEDAVGGGTRNRRDVWDIPTKPYSGAHFAVFPPSLVESCILAGSRRGDLVLDPFMGSGTTAEAAIRLGRDYTGCELNPQYVSLQRARILTAHGI